MPNEQVIAKLQALKEEPGMQGHWQDKIQYIIDELAAPPPAPPSPPPIPPLIAEEAPKSKVTTAAHVAPAKTKGK